MLRFLSFNVFIFNVFIYLVLRSYNSLMRLRPFVDILILEFYIDQ